MLKFAPILVLAAVACAPGPAPKSLTRTLEAKGDNVKYSFEGVSAEGTGVAYSFTVAYDGKESAITGSMPGGADTISIKRIDANNFETTLKKAGKVIGTAKSEVSQDGKVTTVTAEGTNADGQATTSSAVYDKV